MQLVRSLDNQLDKSAGPSAGRGSGVTVCLLPLVLLDFVWKKERERERELRQGLQSDLVRLTGLQM